MLTSFRDFASKALILRKAVILRIGKPRIKPKTEFRKIAWSWREESNPRPADYKSAALPTELRQPGDNLVQNFSQTY
jgi:hypothetical protein